MTLISDFESQELATKLSELITGIEPSNVAFSKAQAVGMLEQLSVCLGQSDNKLRSVENRARLLITAMPIGLLITSEEGEVLASNPASVTLFKCDYADQLVSRTLSDLFQLDGQPFQANGHNLQADPINALTLVGQTLTGQRFPADTFISQFDTANGSNLLVMIQDVTDRHELEKLKREFVTMLSHDLRTPLTSIKLFLQFLASGGCDDNLTDMKQRARRIENVTSTLVEMVNNLLDIEKLEAGKSEMLFETVSCADIVPESIQSIEFLAQENGISVRTEGIDPNVHVKADSHYIARVLINLLSNAIKFSMKGQEVVLKIEVDGLFVKFFVLDQGPGISEEFRRRIFNRFEQAIVHDARTKQGSGLGLSIAKSIIELHGGTIGVERRNEGGTCFWFTLERVEI